MSVHSFKAGDEVTVFQMHQISRLPRCKIRAGTMSHNHCRYCDDWRDQNMIRYGARHYAHPKCWLDRGRRLSELPWHQIEQMPFRLLKDRGLEDEARRLIDAKNVPQSARQKRLEKILGKPVQVNV